MIKYVVGIIFDDTHENTLLIRKQRPIWQLGKLNGVGGKIEENETSYEAMVRECEEECGLVLYNWQLFDNYSDNNHFSVDFFTIKTSGIHRAVSRTDEQVGVFNINTLNYSCVVSPTDYVLRKFYKRGI